VTSGFADGPVILPHYWQLAEVCFHSYLLRAWPCKIMIEMDISFHQHAEGLFLRKQWALISNGSNYYYKVCMASCHSEIVLLYHWIMWQQCVNPQLSRCPKNTLGMGWWVGLHSDFQDLQTGCVKSVRGIHHRSITYRKRGISTWEDMSNDMTKSERDAFTGALNTTKTCVSSWVSSASQSSHRSLAQ